MFAMPADTATAFDQTQTRPTPRPDGAPTAYLFTDIDASTERWERAPAAMAEAVARHDAIVRALIARHGGRVRDRAGDGFFAVFETGAPLACALEVQLALQREDWSAVGGLEVRIGVHCARRASESGAEQVDVNRAARIAASGWGGQIVVSQEALEQFPLPERALLVDLGLCGLKGVEAPMHLLSLTHPDLRRSVFPAPRALLSHGRTVPLDRAPLYGREHEISEIAAQLDGEQRFVNLTGAGGQGKTRLAIAAAATASSACPVYYCQLEANQAPEDALTALGRALGLANTSPSTGAISAHLRDKQALLVLDAADCLVGRADIISDLLQHCPLVRCIATSREPLGAGHVLRLKGLDAPVSAAAMREAPAAKLFEAAARAQRPGFKLGSDDVTAFRAICGAVGGSPLALLLVAEWTGVLTLEEISARLHEGVSFLAELGEDGLRQGLARAMGGSWAILNERDRRVLTKLSVLRPNFDAAAAAYVADASPADLIRFERKALLDQAGERRFTMHPFVRDFARAQSTDADAARARHCEYYLGLLRRKFAEARGEAQAPTLAAIDEDFENIAEAWRNGVSAASVEEAHASIEALFYVCVLPGRYQDAIRLFGYAQHPDIRGYALAVLANCYVQTGDYPRADDALAEASRSDLASPLGQAHCKQALANMAHVRGDADTARALYVEAYDLRAAHGDIFGAYYSICSIAWLSVQRNEIERAREMIELSARLCQRAGHLGGMIGVHSCAADLARLEGRREDAAHAYRQAADIAEATDHPQLRAPLLVKLSTLLLESGAREQSVTLQEEALESARAVGDQRVAANVLVEMARLLSGDGRHGEARTKFRAALAVARDLAASPLISVVLFEWSRSELSGGDRARAKRLASALLSIDSLQPAMRAFCTELGASAAGGAMDVQDTLNDILNEDVFGIVRL